MIALLLSLTALAQDTPPPAEDGAPVEGAEEATPTPEEAAAAEAAAELEALAEPARLEAQVWEDLLPFAPVTFTMEARPDPDAPWEPAATVTFTAEGQLFIGEDEIYDLELAANVARWGLADNPHQGSLILVPRGPWRDAPEGLALVGELASYDEDLVELRGVISSADEGIVTGDDAWDAPPIVIPPEVLAEYDRRKLVVLDSTDKSAPWVVEDGAGNPIDSFYFATMTQDLEAQELLDQELKTARIVGWSVAGAGVAMVGLAAIPVFTIDHELDRPVRQTYEDRVNAANYDTIEEYEDAVDQQLVLYRQDLLEYRTAEAANTDKRWTALALVSGGLMAMTAAPYTVQGMVADRDQVHETWSKERAEALVDAYNAQLRVTLGIPDDWEDPWEESPTEDGAADAVAPIQMDRAVRVEPGAESGGVGFTVRF